MSSGAAPWPDLEQLPCMVLRLSTECVVLQGNRAFLEFCGGATAADAGLLWQALLGPESRATLANRLLARADFSLHLRMQCAPRSTGGACWLDCDARWQPPTAARDGHYLCVLYDVTESRSAELSARARADQFQLLADNVPVLIAYYQASTLRCLFANKLYAQTFGWDEQSIVGHTVAEIIGEPAARQIQPQVDQVIRERRSASYERELVGADGQRRWIEVNLLPHVAAEGDATAAFVLIADITKHRLAEQAVRESEERLAQFMQASAEGIVFHQDGVITDANPPVSALTGYSVEELRGRQTLSFIAPDQLARAAATQSAGAELTYDSAVIHKDGRRIPVELTVRTMLRNGQRMRMTLIRDLRDRQAAQERIHHLAHHDALTQLPNRMSFMETLEHRITGARSSDSQLALLFIDLDHFKRVNDSLGHLIGDTLLHTVSQRIVQSLRSTDLVARFGGDEFVVLLPGVLQRSDVEEATQKLLAAIEVPVNADGRLISVTPSVGIALFPHDGQTADELIKNADTAMYLAKARGRATYQFFTPAMARSAYAALVMESQMTQALEREEFVLHFQPQVRSHDGVLVGVEALIRWNHPERGLLMPDHFIPLAEQQRLMLPIGQWVLRDALRCARRWHDAGVSDVPVAVNLSSVQFQAGGFIGLIADLLREEGVPGRLLELELTERMLMDDLGEVKDRLSELKAMGIRISVDDFGTGYSSLGHLKELPIDKMKIDRSFVKDLPDEHDSAAIARAIVQLARSLDITVIAEGVETIAQQEFLTRVGCDELQGELVSAPLPAAAFEAWAIALAGPALV